MKIRRAVHYWQTWIVVAYFILAAVTVTLIRDDRRQVQDINARIADRTAAAETQYHSCIDSITTLHHVNEFVDGVRGLTDVLLQNALATHKVTAPNSALYDAQAESIQRLRASKQLVRTVVFRIPTKGECVQQFANAVGSTVSVPR